MFASGSVHRVWIVGARLALHPLPLIEFAEETALIPLVTHARAERFYRDQHRVPVAIGGDILDHQPMTGCLTLEPKLIPGPAIEGRVTSLDREPERFFVHESDHQNTAALFVLNDRGNQAVEF